MFQKTNASANRTPHSEYRQWVHPLTAGGLEQAGKTIRAAILFPRQASVGSMVSVFEDFQAMNMLAPGPSAGLRFKPTIVSEGDAPRRSISGLEITRQEPLDSSSFDVVIMPALYDDGCLSDPGYGPILSRSECDWLLNQHANGAVMATMCSGAYGLAETGLLDGHSSAMIELYTDQFSTAFPAVDVKRKRALVVSGASHELITGGQTAYSADVVLYVIAHFFGVSLAFEFASLYGKSWSAALHDAALRNVAVEDGGDHVVGVVRKFFDMHLADAALVETAAKHVNLSVRTLSRRFSAASGVTPRDYILELRMARAMRLLSATRLSVDSIAEMVGYSDRSSFAKMFRNKVGIPPAEYRSRFQEVETATNSTMSG